MTKEQEASIKQDIDGMAKAAATAQSTEIEQGFRDQLIGYEMCLKTLSITLDVQKMFSATYSKETGVVAKHAGEIIRDEFNGLGPLDEEPFDPVDDDE